MSKGFYSKVDEVVATCDNCNLCASTKHGEFKVQGNGKKKILIVAEYPTKKEDDLSKMFYGQTYDYLRDALKLVGVSLEEDCWYVHGVRCKPPHKAGKVKIPPQAYTNCRVKLINTIKELKPKKVITLGQGSSKGSYWAQSFWESQLYTV
jgi:uracil-DNA glycosylase family 4